MVSIVPVLSWVAAFAGAAIAIACGPRPVARAFVLDRWLRYVFVFPVGFMGFWAALGHLVFPVRVAQAIGWQTSPLQFEVAVANLGIGCAGLYAAFRSFEARLATNLVLACFLIGGWHRPHSRHRHRGQFRTGECRPDLVHRFADPNGDLSVVMA